MRADFDSKFSTLTDQVHHIEDQIHGINQELLKHDENAQEQDTKISDVTYTIFLVEDHLEKKVGTIQQKFEDFTKNDQTFEDLNAQQGEPLKPSIQSEQEDWPCNAAALTEEVENLELEEDPGEEEIEEYEPDPMEGEEQEAVKLAEIQVVSRFDDPPRDKFRMLVRAIPLHIPFEEAWAKFPLKRFFMESYINEEHIEDHFMSTRLSLYPDAPSHIKNLWRRRRISEEDLEEFNRAGKALPPGTSFMNAWIDYNIHCFFNNSKESMEDMRDLFLKALEPKDMRTLHKVNSPGRFLITCSIRGVEFKDALCDSGSCINLMSMRAAEKIGLSTLQPSGIRIGLANSSSTTPEGMISDIHVRIGNCNVPTDFQVINVEKGRPSQLILGGSFLATTGAIIDWPNRRISFANIDREVFYEAVPFVPTSQRPRRRSNDPRGKPPDIGNIKKLCLRTEDSSHIA